MSTKMITVLGVAVVLLAGCASGPHYWTRQDASEPIFQSDHESCFKAAYVGYGVGNEQAYKGCMRSKGWERIQGRAGQVPTIPYYRGPEGDDDFTTLSSDERKVQMRQDAGRAMTPEEYQCARARRTMSQRPPPGVVCP